MSEKLPSWFTKNKRKKLKKLLLGEISDYFIKLFESDEICMSVSWAISACMTLSKIPAQPIRVELVVGNQKAIDYISEHGSVKFERYMLGNHSFEKDGIWTISLGTEAKGMYPLHALILVEDGTLIDMTLKQTNRPHRNLAVRNFWTTSKKLPPYIFSIKAHREMPFRGVFGNLSLFEQKQHLNHVLKRMGEVLNRDYPVIKSMQNRDQNKTYYKTKITKLQKIQ